MTDGFGAITWWGFSPAIDLQDKDIHVMLQDTSITTKPAQKDCINILLIGAGDCRHIMKTIAKSYSHTKTQLNFFVVEANLELYARTMLFFTLVLESPQRMGLQEKTETFLELFGNTLIREQSMEYVERMSKDLIKMVTDPDYLEKKLPMFDLSMLKFKELDFFEGILKFWRIKDRKVFDVVQCWDLRLRKHLGTRYDAKKNMFDWDFSMKLSQKGAEIIHHRNYALWRDKGVAYEIREGTYDVPNKTVASGIVFKVEGERLPRRGYWGDIVVSPYIQFGIECEEKKFYKKSNNQLTSTSQDVAEYNVLSLLHEIMHGTKYEAPAEDEDATTPEKSEQQQKATLTEITEEEEDEEEESKEENEETKDANEESKEEVTNPWDLEYEALPLPNVKIHFLSTGAAGELQKKSKFNRLFNIVYLSNSMVHHLNEGLSQTFSDRTTVVLETAKFMIELKEEQQKEYNQKITHIAENIPGCKAFEPVGIDEAFARFTFNRPEAS